MFTTEDGDVDSTSPNTSTCQLRPRDSTRTSSFRYSLSDEESKERQFDLEERGKEPVNISTTQDTDTEVNDQEQDDILNTETVDSTYRCILNEEDPDLDNPDLYNCKTCRTGLAHIRSRRIFPEADHCDKISYKNRDLVTNQENHEWYDPRTQEASLPSSTVQTISSAVKHLSIDHPSVEFDDQERSTAYHLQDGFSTINLVDENEIRSITSARDKGYNNLAIAHQTEVKAGRSFKCKQCPKRFGHKQSLKNHTLVHGAEARFICDVCSKGFMIESKFKNHLKVHAINVEVKFPFKCDNCSKQYSEKRGLEKHMLDHGAQAEFICNDCSKGFMIKSEFKRHLKVHEINVDVKYPLKCDKCPKQYSSKRDFEQHKLVHGVQAKFICNDCSKGFMVKCLLRTHLRVHEINVDVKFPLKCNNCPKQYSSKRNLKRHMIVHGAQAKFTCNDCSKGFMDKYCLRTHLTIHEGKFPFQCNKCKKKFTRKINLKRHIMLVHEGEPKFTCKFCHKGFMNKWHLKNHSRIHETDVEAKYPFKCTKCSKRFSFTHNLKKHMFIHAARDKIKC